MAPRLSGRGILKMHDPRERRRQAIKAEAARRRIQVTQRGAAFVLLGPGVDLTVADLADVNVRTDLVPYMPRKHVEP